MWFIVFVLIGGILYMFFSDLNKDNQELQHQRLSEKFSYLVEAINMAAYNGQGQVNEVDKRRFNLYQSGQNQIIMFDYSTGHLTITWKYKYFQKEVVHEKRFANVRNISLIQQENMAETMINEMSTIIDAHQKNVMRGL